MEKRQAHMLKPTVGDARPGNIIFFDTETYQTIQPNGNIKHTLRLGVGTYLRRFKRRGYVEMERFIFADYPSFIEWVNRCTRKKSTTYLVAHNIVFDLAIVHAYEELAGLGWKLLSLYSKETTSIFRWQDGERRLTAIDNMNLFIGKLERWGKIFNFHKGHVDFDTVNDDELLTYCTRDVEIMVRSWLEWLKFLDLHDLGNFKITTASTAFSAWRHRFMGAPVHIHVDPNAIELERQAYHGGRTECFWTGKRSDGPFHYLDVNNMYGYVLSKFEYPCGLWNVDLQPTVSRLLRKLEKQSVVARVLLKTTEPVFPMMHTNYTIYPVGEFITTLTTPEIILAFEQGWLLDVYAFAWYRRAALFADFIHTFHTLRMEYRHNGNEGYEQISKLMMNSLYGKFGQSGYDQTRIGDAPINETWSNMVVDHKTGEVRRMFCLGGGIYEERKAGEAANSFPGIAAHVTAYARLYLWKLINYAGRENVFYCDTDSMIVNEQGLSNVRMLLDPDQLGYLKIEHTSDTLEIHAPKDYAMGTRVKVKGVKQPDGLSLDGAIPMQQWQRLSGQMLAGSTNDFIVKNVTKHLARRVRSGIVQPSGWVYPFDLTEAPGVVASAHQKQLFESLSRS